MTWPQYLRRECSYKGWVTPLAPQETEALAVLAIRGPRPTPLSLLIDVLWAPDPNGGPINAGEIVNTLVLRLRAKLPGAIGGRRQFGWYLKGT